MDRWLTRGEASVSFLRASFSPRSFNHDSWKQGYAHALPASLGGVRTDAKQAKKRKDDDYVISSPLPDFVVSRIRNELVDGVLHDEVINRAKRRKSARVEEEALLLLI